MYFDEGRKHVSHMEAMIFVRTKRHSESVMYILVTVLRDAKLFSWSKETIGAPVMAYSYRRVTWLYDT